MADLKHVLHGKRVEKLSDDGRQLTFEDLEVTVAVVQTVTEQASPSAVRPRQAHQRTLAISAQACCGLNMSSNLQASTAPVTGGGCNKSAKTASSGWTS